MPLSELWPDLKPWLLAVWAAYLVVLAGWIVLQKREPIATLSWVLSLAALPWIGLLIYHFLGPQRIVRQQRRRSLSRRSLEPVLPSDLVTSEDCATVSHLAQTITHFAPSSAVDVKLLVGGKRILLLGAGGAVRGVLEPLLAQGPAALVIANRTVAKAEQLVHEFADLGPVAASGFDWIDAPVDLIINGTSASLAGELPPIAPSLIAPGHTVCYDMMYAKEPTAFNRWACEHGAARTLDGLGMLVEQAAEAFHLWRGVRPDTAPVLQHLRELLARG